MNQAPEGRAQTKAPTVADVARLAGVSTMTVSRVVNGETCVRPPARARVRAAIAALNYVPNPAARSLAGSRPMTIGFLYSDPRAGYLNGFLLGLLGKTSLRHVHLNAQCCEKPEEARQALEDMIAQGIDGLILPPPFCQSPGVLRLVADSAIPAVTVSAGNAQEGLYGIDIDDFGAAYELTRHLLALGHRRLGFIMGDPVQSCSRQRLAGFQAAVADAGLDPQEDVRTAQGQYSYQSGLSAAEQLLCDEARPTAVFASNDDMAAATVAVAQRLGMFVPSDLTVVGFDDAPLATTIWPELTTVRQPIREMAGVAVDLLVRHIRAWRNGIVLPFSQHTMEHSLVRRQSDAAPKYRPSVRLRKVGAG